MFKSSLATHSSIDHDLFPLLTVRSCVSEADESKNGPRFCAEDKMTGGAYEIRSRKLDLEAEQLVDGAGCRDTHRNLSPNDLRTIRRQQERIDALLTATAHCAVPPCVALPIDVYIQEQPSTAYTYVASVDAFSGLSLGDIIRSGWGMMEESVFLEILNAVEAFGYASARLPPHGNLSSDAIKQLLIVRDGASEARQPSRWVVSDWLLLSDDSVTSFDPQAFVADLEWVLHSSFAQLHISTTTAQGSTLMPAARVEELVGETVDRIRAHLLRQGAEAHHITSSDGLTQLSDGGLQTDTKAFHAHLDASSSGVTDVDGASAKQTSASNEDGVPTFFDSAHGNTANWASAATGSAREFQATAQPSSPPRSFPDPSAATASTAAASSLNTLPATSLTNESQGSRGAADKCDSEKEAFRVARQMSLKDKVAYHQAALRSEQLLVNRHRRKNAPLPPRPQPVSAHIHNARPILSPSASEEDEEFFYDPPAVTSPIDVKPSAYLMQGHRSSPNGRGAGSARKLQSPRSARTLNGEARTPCERSRSATTPPPSQQSRATLHASASCDQLRERLLDDVVSIAVLNQRRRAEDHLLQQEAERRRREERQQVLSLSTPPRSVAGERLSTPNLLDNRGASISYPTAPSSPSVEAKAAKAADNHRRACRRGTVPCGSAANVSHGGSASPSGYCLVLMASPHDAAMNRFDDASKSPEPTPPSPRWSRIVRPTFCQRKPAGKAAAGTRVAPPRASARGAATTAVASRLPQTAGKTMVPSQTFLYGVRTGTAATIVRSDTAKMSVNARAAAAMGGVATEAIPGNGSNLSRQLAASAMPRSGRSTTAAGNRAAWIVGQQQRSARARAAAPLVQRNTRASTASPLSSPRQKTAQQSAAAPFVKPLTFASVLGRLASPRKAPAVGGASSPPPASRVALGQLVPARRAAATSSGSFSYFSNGSTRKSITDAKFQALRCPSTARPPPTQLRLAASPRVYQRMSSTGVLRSPRNGVPVTPLRRSSAETPTTALQLSSSIGEVSRSVLQKPAELEAPTPIALRTTQPRLPVAADSASAKGRASVSPKPLRRLLLQKDSPGLSARHAVTLDTQNTDLPPTSATEDSLTSPRTPPPPPPPPLAFTNGAAATGAVRRFTCADPPAQSGVAEVENRAPRGRNVGGPSLSPGSRPMAASALATQREKKGKAHAALPCAEPLTLGSVRPVKKASPGIPLLRHRSSTM
ncbi:conserved hypothetical protein [Leishmania major strain Friedlin]|uniref:Uncharacterized protein n=1 Tax=Leishmania major TaxID=5664 RepID=Q4Q750_LEIMA|nr:conserved hypothetical protein [Leishmania major strain Friedlin]CAG9578478.1 hypothetical_protein_-_conserved [Leishmania major strain Friedlin]CAJ06521.1 conserved hypothetical protein [Leishmania major strain Friedlin]|eukprot:XP_001684848.1 conserved hypothetical protein [Leishmania major strain Friedlin]